MTSRPKYNQYLTSNRRQVPAGKDYSNSLSHLSSHLIIVSLRRAGAFSREYTKNLAPQGGAFTRALESEKLKAPLFPDPSVCVWGWWWSEGWGGGGAGGVDTNDWCIIPPL